MKGNKVVSPGFTILFYLTMQRRTQKKAFSSRKAIREKRADCRYYSGTGPQREIFPRGAKVDTWPLNLSPQTWAKFFVLIFCPKLGEEHKKEKGLHSNLVPQIRQWMRHQNLTPKPELFRAPIGPGTMYPPIAGPVQASWHNNISNAIYCNELRTKEMYNSQKNRNNPSIHPKILVLEKLSAHYCLC